MKPVAFFLSILMFSGTAIAKDVVPWLSMSFPPYMMDSGEQKGRGQVDVLMAELLSELPQFEHRKQNMNWSRFWRSIKKGKHFCNPAAFKNQERMDYTLFSKPVVIVLGHQIIMHPASAQTLGQQEKSLSLATLMQRPDLRGLLESTRSYSAVLDELFQKHAASSNIQRMSSNATQLIRMLAKHRIDYLVEFPISVGYIAAESGINDEFERFQIQEIKPYYATGHIACAKNEWGQRVISAIDQVLTEKLYGSEQHKAISRMWYDQQSADFIMGLYDEVFMAQ